MGKDFDLSKPNSHQVAEDFHYERWTRFKAIHFDDKDSDRLFVADANSRNEFVPEHYHQRLISAAVTGRWVL